MTKQRRLDEFADQAFEEVGEPKEAFPFLDASGFFDEEEDKGESFDVERR